MIHKLNKIDRKLRDRVEKIATIAKQNGDDGIVAWTIRAAEDALALGRIRDKDIATLERLEDTYGHEFYNRNGSAVPA